MNFEHSYEYSSLSSPSSSSSGTDQRLYSDNSSGSKEKSPLSSLVSQSSPQLVPHKKRAGRKKFKETRHPIYRGVRERKNDKWVCEVREPNNSKSRIWLGTHSSPEMAARAYDVAALALRGKSAPLNFENSPWVLPRAKSSSIKDIQSAVAQASLAFPFFNDTVPPPPMTNSMSQTYPFDQLFRRVENNVDEVQEIPSTYLDEEALFNMPSLIASMAEGMLLDPPQEGYYFDDVEYNVDTNLWSDTDENSSSELVKVIQSSVSARQLLHPIYRGVRERKNYKWVCEVREPGNSKSEYGLEPIDLLRWQLELMMLLHWLFEGTRAKSSSHRDIQIAAVEAARSFPLPTYSKSSLIVSYAIMDERDAT
ncbi:hypothetical protein MKX01_029922 [Papaver californicum]|nr:hypothetical protein MKX01_029922 [Papaver californicum]